MRDTSSFDNESFNTIFPELTFTCICCDGSNHEVELIKGGRNEQVNFENRLLYCHELEYFRLHQFDVAISHLKKGMKSIIKSDLLPIFTWEELEVDINAVQNIIKFRLIVCILV